MQSIVAKTLACSLPEAGLQRLFSFHRMLGSQFSRGRLSRAVVFLLCCFHELHVTVQPRLQAEA